MTASDPGGTDTAAPGREAMRPTLALWAKLSRLAGPSWTYHPLFCHMLDVGLVAAAMWRTVLSAEVRRRLAASFGLDEDRAGRWLALFAALHDLGKASPAFQLQAAGVERGFRARLVAAGLTIPQSVDRVPHGTITASRLRSILATFSMPDGVARTVATAVGGHHGRFPSSQETNVLGISAAGDASWDRLRTSLARSLALALNVGQNSPQRLDNATAMLVAGFVSVADWIGSVEACFPHAVQDSSALLRMDLAAYCEQAVTRSESALARLGWSPWPAARGARSLVELFPNVAQPNALQEAIAVLERDMNGPGLVLIEAPMGEGKTEAAMYLADRWAVSAGQRGVYFALPTQATSNQMFSRVRAFLAGRYTEGPVDLQLLHGHASLSSEFETLRRSAEGLFEPGGICDEESGGGVTPNVVAAEWFTHRKRGLLAPFGVGTVDQALLAVLQSRHVFVRLFGLAHKTVIIDEVHAYDTYMTALLERLLTWLAAIGSSVVLLSATLPRSRRSRLVDAYAKGLGLPPAARASGAAYPRVTWVSGVSAGERTVETSPRSTKSVAVEWVNGRLSSDDAVTGPLASRLRTTLAEGGCAAVICNTVGRAQRLYKALKSSFPGTSDDGQPEVDLLHARFLFDERERRERRTLVRFGKPGGKIELSSGETQNARRPRRSVLVATQIIEQSLDLDFDLLVTDLAPADLVLQRIGRLHRHPRERPAALRAPAVWLLGPDEGADGVPSFGRDSEAVYDPHVLLRSWLALKGRDVLRVPDDVEAVIEAVYGESPCPDELSDALRSRWTETRLRLLEEAEKDAAEAHVRWLKLPSYTGALWTLTQDPREEDAPEFHQAHRALTRLSEPTVPVVCLYRSDRGPSLDAAGAAVVDLDVVPTTDAALRLLRQSILVSDRRVVHRLIDHKVPSGWRRSPLLRHHRAVLFEPDGWVAFGRHRLSLDQEIGLTVSTTDGGSET